MRRIEAIKKIMFSVIDECVIFSNGMISREVYQVKDRDRNFYIYGAMGSALGIGIGLAYQRPDLKVFVINGDGAALMELGTLVLSKKLKLPNLFHFILDNNAYASTGGVTCSDAVDFESIGHNTITIKVSNETGDAPRIPLTGAQVKGRFMNAIKKINVQNVIKTNTRKSVSKSLYRQVK